MTPMKIQRREDLVRLLQPGAVGVELGVAAGKFSFQLLERHAFGEFYMVDKWNDHHGDAERLAVLERCKGHPNARVLHMTFDEALGQFPDEHFDFIYIDGYAHTGQEGGQTLARWWPKLKAGGLYAGHDYDEGRWQPTVTAVNAFAAGLGKVIWTTSGDAFASWYFIKSPAPGGGQSSDKPSAAAAVERAAAHGPAMLAPGASVVLVGNGPGVLRGELGAAIDAHDEVIRFNAFKTVGLEQHAGRRTTLWSMFGQGKLPGDDVRPERVIYTHAKKMPADALPYAPREVFGIPQKFLTKCRAEVRAYSRRDEAGLERLLCSSGLKVVLWLLHEHGVKCISLAGFDHFTNGKGGQHHYWAKTTHDPREHDGEAEARMFTNFERAGRVKYLGRN